jgi:hypothetical protein
MTEHVNIVQRPLAGIKWKRGKTHVNMFVHILKCVCYTRKLNTRLLCDYIYKHFQDFQFQAPCLKSGALIKINTSTRLYA